MLFQFFYSFLFFQLILSQTYQEDQNEHCSYWASIGECINNPNYMLNNCYKSCLKENQQLGQQQQGQGQGQGQQDKKNNIPQSFYDIIENDINGNIINYQQFRNKLVYIVNVASQCGYTNENYELLKLLSPLRSNKFEILIFPCNQFGSQEPGNPLQITNFAQSRGYNGIIMSKGDVNGPNTRPTFQFLKQATNKKNINW